MEAHHLFGTPYDRSTSSCTRSRSSTRSCSSATASTKAHLGYPDMRVAIGYALHHPDRADLPIAAAGPGRARRRSTSRRPTWTRSRACGSPARRREAGRHRAVRAQRRQRGRRPRLPQRPAAVHGHPGGDRGDARAARPARVHDFEALYAADAEARDGRRRADRGGARMSWLLAFLGFAALIILHEAGHFFAAKAVGMRVERFSLFFPPLIARCKRGETEYAIGSIPLGGYVKITGMNPAEEIPPEHAHRAYYRQPVWKRIVVIGAGPGGQHRARVRDPVGAASGPTGSTSRTAGSSASTAAPAAERAPAGRPASSRSTASAATSPTLREQIATHTLRGRAGRRLHGRDAAPRSWSRRRRAAHVSADAGLRREPRTTCSLGFGYDRRRASRPSGPARRPTRRVDRMWFFTTKTSRRSPASSRPRSASEISGVVGAYETTRQAIELDTDARALPARAHLPVARRHQPVPVPAARRRAHLLGAGREGARPRDPVQRDGAGRLRRLRARDRAVHDRPHERHRAAHRGRLRGQVASGMEESTRIARRDDRRGVPHSPSRTTRTASRSARRTTRSR